MGHYVTIEGSLTPTTLLARGVRKTVAVTDEVRRLVQIGGAVVLAGSLDEPEATEDEHSAESTLDNAEAGETSEPDSAPDGSQTEDAAESASKRGRARRTSSTELDTTRPDGAS